MPKVKGQLISIVHIVHDVEFEIEDDLVARIASESDDGFLDRGGDTHSELEAAVHQAAPKIDLNGGSYAKGDYEYEDFTIDGKPVLF